MKLVPRHEMPLGWKWAFKTHLSADPTAVSTRDFPPVSTFAVQ